MWEHFKVIWARLGDADFQILALEPALFWGVGLGMLVFLGASVLKEGKAQKLGLLIVIASCLAVLPYMHQRMEALPEIESLMPGAVEELRAVERVRAETQWVFLTLAGLALLTFFLGRGGKAGAWLTVITVVAGIGVVFLALGLHLREAAVFHPNVAGFPAPTPAAPDAAPAPVLTPGPEPTPAAEDAPGTVSAAEAAPASR